MLDNESSRVTISHNSGFFSNCSVRLKDIVGFFNHWKKPPAMVDSSRQFQWYRPVESSDEDLASRFFATREFPDIPYRKPVSFSEYTQFHDYRKLDFESLNPFVQRYFSPTEEIVDVCGELVAKYELEDLNNTCALLYRGNDKGCETALPPYDDFLDKAKSIERESPGIRFWLQSDESEFLFRMSDLLEGSVVMWSDIRHIPRENTSVDKIDAKRNFFYIQRFLAIVFLMSKSRFLVCASGNCDLWLALYRGHTHGLSQWVDGGWAP